MLLDEMFYGNQTLYNIIQHGGQTTFFNSTILEFSLTSVKITSKFELVETLLVSKKSF